jgi:hypothetical protein
MNMPPPTGTPTQAPPPKEPWHTNRWKLAAAAGVLGLLLGFGMSSPDRAAADRDIREAKKSAAEIIEDAEATQRDLLGDVDAQRDNAVAERDSARREAAALTKTRDRITGQVATLKRDLGKLTAERRSSTFEGDGIYLVGSDIKAGTYKAPAMPGCYYALLSGTTGSFDDIISNNNVDGPVVLEVSSSAEALQVTGCSTFTMVR